MAFLNPLVLVALAAAAIPLLIHLFNFRRARRIEYSTLRFLTELQRKRLQRVRVKRWLLLLMRTLAVLCLIAAFARPIMVGPAFSGDAKVSMALVVDNSLSMSLRDADGPYLDQARRHSAALAASADELLVFTTTLDAPAAGAIAQGAIEDVALDARTGSAEGAIAAAARVLSEQGAFINKEVYFVGDLQRSTLLDTVRHASAPGIRIGLVPVGGRRQENVAIESVQVTSRIVEVNEPVRVEATLVSYLDAPVPDYVASLYLGGERVAQQSIELVPGVRSVVRFTTTPGSRGWLYGLVRAEDDGFAADNQHYFTLHVPERRRVLVVRGSSAVVEYVTMALAPSGDAIEIESIDRAALARTDLRAYDAVLLVGLREFSSGEVMTLDRFVGDGGGLMVFASESPSGANELLSTMGGGAFGAVVESGAARGPIASVGALDTEHALFEGVFDDAARMERPDVYRAATYAPRSGAENTLLWMSNGMPLIQEIRRGQGRALVATVGPDPSWSELPVRGLFVPLMHRAVHYLAAGESVQGQSLVTGQGQSIRLGNTAGRVRLVTPSDEEITPEQRQVVGATVIDIPKGLDAPGYYSVMQQSTIGSADGDESRPQGVRSSRAGCAGSGRYA